MAQNPSSALKPTFVSAGKQDSDIALIDETIQKIAYLLVLGFGEAGNQVFTKILQSDSLEIDFFKEARVIYAIFGFCDIRNFTDCTEVLKEEVLFFVNSLAEIVHTEVANSLGSANKNIGDAFLLVWKLKNIKDSNIRTVLDMTLDQGYKG